MGLVNEAITELINRADNSLVILYKQEYQIDYKHATLRLVLEAGIKEVYGGRNAYHKSLKDSSFICQPISKILVNIVPTLTP